jgi:hypothetical protein
MIPRNTNSLSLSNFPQMRYILEATCVVIGAFIGSRLDVVSRVEGLSMYPLMTPGDKLLHVPLWLHPACWRRHTVPTPRGAESDESAGWSFLQGRVVLVQVRENITVCKRVLGVSNNPSVRAKWENSHFSQLEWEEGKNEELRDVENNLGDDEIAVGNVSLQKSAPPLPEQPCPIPLTIADDGRSAAEAIGMERAAQVEQQVQHWRRSEEWDWCLEQATPQTEAWIWVEGDNSSNSFDSRHVGALPLDCVRSIVVAKLWPSLAIL